MATTLYGLTKDTDEIRKDVLENIGDILIRRKWLDSKTEQVEKLKNSKNSNEIYSLTLDGIKTKDFSNKKIFIKYLPQNITSAKDVSLVNFFNGFQNNYKIVIVKKINKNTIDNIFRNFNGNNIEFLEENELIFNLFKHHLCPIYEPLDEEEKKNVMKSYDLTIEQIPKIYKTDPAARLLKLDKNQLVKIIRYSTTSGQYPTYRIVI
jgi:DNA-directed RNA polymerase subunit H